MVERRDDKRGEAPHRPAAFINAIAEEGTKAEAVEYLQKEWNESCQLRDHLRYHKDAINRMAALVGKLGCTSEEVVTEAIARLSARSHVVPRKSDKLLGRMIQAWFGKEQHGDPVPTPETHEKEFFERMGRVYDVMQRASEGVAVSSTVTPEIRAQYKAFAAKLRSGDGIFDEPICWPTISEHFHMAADTIDALLAAPSATERTTPPKGLKPYPLEPVAGCRWPGCDCPGRWDCNANISTTDGTAKP